MLNQGTDRATIICFPPGSGGKFLLASLGLADECILPNAHLAQQQLDNKLDWTDKLNFYKEQLQIARGSDYWNDFDLGCIQFFGFPPWEIAFVNPELSHITEKYYRPVVRDVLNSHKKFFLTSHDTGNLRYYMNFWPGAKIIFFTNYLKFKNFRNLNSVGGTWERMFAEIYENDIRIIQSTLPPEKFFVWNCAWYDSQEDFINNLIRCYNWMGITMHDESNVIDFYQDWIATIRN